MGKSGTVEQSPSTSAAKIWNKDQPETITGNAAQPFARVRPGADRINPRDTRSASESALAKAFLDERDSLSVTEMETTVKDELSR